MKSFFNFNGIKLLFFSVIVISIPTQLAFAAVSNEGFVPDHYIVTLQPNEQAASKAPEMARTHGLGLRHVYKHALNGFSAFIPPGRLNALRHDPRVVSIEQDQYVSIAKKCSSPPCGGGGNDYPISPPPSQEIPTGISRIGGPGTGTIDIDVAVIDTGIDSSHPDLNVLGGYNCSKGRRSKYSDGNGHGSHVAGTIGALDNNEGVVGVAPGARLWAVRVLDNTGSGFRSDVICGIDWVTEKANIIEVANMSLGGSGNDAPCNSDSYHQAICNSVAAGVTYVVAAGNSFVDSSNTAPATYDEVITVSALADSDGESGGNGGTPTCRTDEDDTFANFSNFGADVDIIAPGVCILSTWKDGGYNTISGTSMASPHVAGAAALYLSKNPGKTPAQVKQALEDTGNFDWDDSDDGDSEQEPLIDVSSF